jgi:hypothetical protein
LPVLFPSEIHDFDPTPFLRPVFKQVFLDPDSVLLPASRRPPPINVKGSATREELIKLFDRWDAVHRIYICHRDQVAERDVSEVFAVARGDGQQRQIIHRKRRSRREQKQSGTSKDLPHIVLFCSLPLGKKYICIGSFNDLEDFYHNFICTDGRAKTTPVGGFYNAGELRHLEAYQAGLVPGRYTAGEAGRLLEGLSYG